jgi:hypothetical protein
MGATETTANTSITEASALSVSTIAATDQPSGWDVISAALADRIPIAWGKPNPEVAKAWRDGEDSRLAELLAGRDIAALAALAARQDEEAELVRASPGDEMEIEWLLGQGWTTQEIRERQYSDGCLLQPIRLKSMREAVGDLRKEIDREQKRRLSRRLVDEAEAAAAASENPLPVPIDWVELWNRKVDGHRAGPQVEAHRQADEGHRRRVDNHSSVATEAPAQG